MLQDKYISIKFQYNEVTEKLIEQEAIYAKLQSESIVLTKNHTNLQDELANIKNENYQLKSHFLDMKKSFKKNNSSNSNSNGMLVKMSNNENSYRGKNENTLYIIIAY